VDEKRAEAVDISDDLTAVPAVIPTSTVNSDKSTPASKLCLSPIKANAEVTDDDTAVDGLKKKAEERIFTRFYLSTQVGKGPRGLGLIWGSR
jgi:phosphate uptake regulator